MGRIAFWITYLFYTLPSDANDNRRHIHIFKGKGRHIQSLAKIWIEQNGIKNISVAYNKGIPEKDLKIIIQLIGENWEDLNKQIEEAFIGKNIDIIELKIR
jgi:arsenate reductase-like glutaredoxin family protein